MRRLGVLALVTVGAVTCALPTDRSGALRVALDSLPTLLLKDSLRLDARLVDSGGVEVPRAALAFASSNPTVFIVDPDGMVRAVGVGVAQLTVSALGFAEAVPFTQMVRVRGKLEVDSVRPLDVRFGDSVEVFGVGLEPDSIFSIAIGGVEAEASAFVPQDPARPEREGMLRVWVPPPAERRSAMTLLGFAGGLVLPDTIDVGQVDLFEPNDTVPRPLGQLPQGFRNPALALEARQRETVADARDPADWYTFDNPTPQDRTIIFASEGALGQAFGVVLTDSLEWSQVTRDYAVGPGSWTVGVGTYLCGGLPLTQNGEVVEVEEVLFPLSVLAIRSLPAGRYHVLVPYVPFGTPRSYELRILNQYASLLPPDAAEENDYCDVAAPLPASGSFTVDNPHDVDWFRFTFASPVAQLYDIALTAQNAEADLDLYFVRDFRPDSLVLLGRGSEPGPNERIAGLINPGDYFLIVVDFQGQPTSYTLTAQFGTLPAGALEPGSVARPARRPASPGPRPIRPAGPSPVRR